MSNIAPLCSTRPASVCVAIALILFAGCGDDSGESAATDAGDSMPDLGLDTEADVDAGTADGASDAVDDVGASQQGLAEALGEFGWETCYSNTIEGEARLGECVRTTAPLRWDDPEGERIDLFAKYLPADGPVERTVWMLSGGPGFSAHGLEVPGNILASVTPGTDLYLIDHRGTGHSSPLRCDALEPTSEAGTQVTQNEIGPCHEQVFAEVGDVLTAYSSTNAAMDIGALIEALHDTDDQVFVFGISYGTYLAHRYLQLFPDQPDGVIVDSMCAPDSCHLNEQDRWYDRVGRELLATCGDDAACAARFDGNPYDVYAEIVDDPPDNGCMPPGFVAQREFLLRVVPGNLLIDDGLRMALPAMIHRMRRCNEADEAALAHLYGLMLGGSGSGQAPPVSEPYGYVPSLASNVALSELWNREETSEDVFDAWDATTIAFGSSLQLARDYDLWTTYDDPLAGQYAESDVPLLMVQPDDPATPLEQSLGWRDAFDGEHQSFIVVPGSSHNVYLNSPFASDLQRQCGLNLVDQFLRDPRAELDTSCVAEVRQVDFAGSPDQAELIFGAEDFWGD